MHSEPNGGSSQGGGESGGGVGGSGAAAGMDFQFRVGAYTAVRVLAEQSVGFGLPPEARATAVFCETANPTDDLAIQTSSDGWVFIQCKTSVDLSSSASSPFASVIRQFVGQMCHAPPGGRGIDEARDRLVLVVQGGASRTVTKDLVLALEADRRALATSGAKRQHSTTAEDKARKACRAHFDREWQALKGQDPSEVNWRAFVSLCRIQELDVADGGAARGEAAAWLSSAVLEDPAQEQGAWGLLVEEIARLCRRRQGADLRNLRASLVGARMSLRAAPSVAADIQALKDFSLRRLQRLKRFATISWQGSDLKIRRVVVPELVGMAQSGHVIVVGEPGAGKSGCIHDMVAELSSRGEQFILLEAEHVEASNRAALLTSLGVKPQRSLGQILNGWSVSVNAGGEPRPGFLVIDALDAARGLDRAQGRSHLTTLCELIREVQEEAPHWRVVVSMREFDLKHSKQVRALFKGVPHPKHADPSLRDIRHVQVARLNDDEMKAARAQCQPLDHLLSEAGSGKLAALVRNPFNLGLLIELCDAGTPIESLRAVRVQVDLLRAYWDARLGEPGADRAAGERVISEVTVQMKQQRRLRVTVPTLDEESERALTRLVSSGVLQLNTQARGLAEERQCGFPHNILFDYALARTWVRDLGQEVLDELEAESGQDLILFARPSLSMALRALWYDEQSVGVGTSTRAQFWERATAMATSGRLRLIGKIIPAGIAAEEYHSVSDVNVLLNGLTEADDDPANQLFKHMIVAAMTRFRVNEDARRPPDVSEFDWCEVAEAAAALGLSNVDWHARMLLTRVERTADVGVLSLDQKSAANRAACLLLSRALAVPQLSPVLVTALAVACRTCDARPRDTIVSLGPVLGDGFRPHRHEVLRPLAETLGPLSRIDLTFAERVSLALFEQEYPHDDRMPAGSRILPISFGKKDNQELARRAGAASVTASFAEDPLVAARIGTVFIEHSVAARNGGQRQDPAQFQFRGRVASVRDDHSEAWGHRSYASHEPWNAVVATLIDTIKAASTTDSRLCGALLDIVAERAQTALTWQRLLETTTATPTLGALVLDLLRAVPILAGADTSVEAAQCLTALWPSLTPDVRRGIELVILDLPSRMPDRREYAEYLRDRLLGAIPGIPESAEASSRLEALRKTGDVPPVRRLNGGSRVRSVSQDEWLRGRGVVLEAPGNAAIRACTQKVERLRPSSSATSVSVEQLKVALPVVLELKAHIDAASDSQIHEELVDTAEAVYYDVLSGLSRADGLSQDSGDYKTLKRLLLEAAADPRPEAQPEERQDGPTSWGGGQPRIEAAEGLANLAARAKTADVDVIAAVKRLAGDAHWAVRHQVCSRPQVLWEADRDGMWELIERCSERENDRRVLRFFTHNLAISFLKGGESAERIDRILTSVVDRIADEDGTDDEDESVSSSLAFVAMWRVVWEDDAASKARIETWVRDPERHGRKLHKVIVDCRGLMVVDFAEKDEAFSSRVRAWAVGALLEVVNQSLEQYAAIMSSRGAERFVDWPEVDRVAMQRIHIRTDHVSNQVFFASGAFGNRSHDPDDSDAADTPAKVGRFLSEGRLLLERLCDVPIVNVAHDVLKTLAHLIPHDPDGVFQLVHRCVSVAKQDYVEHESMATDVVVAIVERYLAEYPTVFREKDERRAQLLDVLDVFIAAGWQQAFRLTYRLEEVFQ